MQAKPWYTSKTLIFNTLSLAVLAVGLVVDSAGVLALDPRLVVVLGIVIAVGNAGLRLVTNAPILGTPAATDALKPAPH